MVKPMSGMIMASLPVLWNDAGYVAIGLNERAGMMYEH